MNIIHIQNLYYFIFYTFILCTTFISIKIFYLIIFTTSIYKCLILKYKNWSNHNTVLGIYCTVKCNVIVMLITAILDNIKVHITEK